MVQLDEIRIAGAPLLLGLALFMATRLQEVALVMGQLEVTHMKGIMCLEVTKWVKRGGL